jgi:hypothetical protein
MKGRKRYWLLPLARAGHRSDRPEVPAARRGTIDYTAENAEAGRLELWKAGWPC